MPGSIKGDWGCFNDTWSWLTSQWLDKGVASLHPNGAPYTQVFKPLGLRPACLFFFNLSSSKLGPV